MASRRRIRWQFVALGALAILLVLWVVLHRPHKKAATEHAVPVAVAQASLQDIPISITALGAAQAWTSDAIFAQVSGKLIRVNFQEGSDVRAGQVLAEVDPACSPIETVYGLGYRSGGA